MSSNRILAQRMLDFIVWYEDHNESLDDKLYNRLGEERTFWEDPSFCPPQEAIRAMYAELTLHKNQTVSHHQITNDRVHYMKMSKGAIKIEVKTTSWVIILREFQVMTVAEKIENTYALTVVN